LGRHLANRDIGFGRPIVVTGAGGIGKTALVAKYLDSGHRVIEAGPGVGKTALFLSGIERPSRDIWISARDFEHDAPAFDSLMLSRSGERMPSGAVVVLDGADEIDAENRSRVLSHILNFKRVRALITTSRADLELRGGRTLRLGRLSTPEAESLITELSKSIISLDSMQRMLSISDGHPLAISLIAALAKSRDSEELRQVLAGHLYDLRDATPVQQGKLVSVAKPIIISANEGMIEALKKQPKDIFRLCPRKYEELVAELMRDMGYEVTLTKATRDGGKDILASIKTEVGDVLCLIEAKRYREDRKIGVSLVRALYGTLCDYQATNAMLVTTSSYSKDARALQQKHQYQLSLRDYADVANWIQQYGTYKGPKKN
jgi:restriction system protein